MSYKKSIANDYFYAACACGITIAILSIVFSVYIYFDEKKALYSNIAKAAFLSERVITESFNYSVELVSFVGSQVIDAGANNHKKIAEILNGKLLTNQVSKDIFSYTMLDWVNSKKELIVSGPYGVLKEPRDVSFRNYAALSEKHPWKLIFDSPDYGIPSGKYILPAGIGITNKSGEFIGIISLGFNLSSLNKAIEREIQNKYINFIVFSHDSRAVFQSDIIENLDIQQINKTLNKREAFGYLEEDISDKNVQYVYYKKFKQYPFTIMAGYNKQELFNKMYDTLLIRIVEILSIGSVVLIFLLITRKKLLIPVLQLSGIAEKMAYGKFPESIPKFASFEMNILANQLRKIIAYASKLTSANTNLEEKIQERTAELKKALRVKTDFLNNMSHEIRTPLQGFMGISEGLDFNWHMYSDEQKHKYTHEIAKNAKRLTSLVGNLLDLAKFNEGKMILDIDKVSLNQSIEDMIDESKTLYLNNKNIDIIFEYNSAVHQLTAMVDDERISQVLRNLFVNAIKFSPDNEVIIVRLINDRDDEVHFSITDHGIGVPEDELEAIFELFAQSSRTKTRAGGTGLGLPICREIIAAHHGKIWAENNKDSRGSTFHFTIPKFQDNLNKIELQEAVDSSSNSKIKTIMVIDDEESILTTMEIVLTSNHYNVIKANRGVEGLKLINKNYQNIDLIFLDLMMPDIYGINVLESIKKNEHSKNIPVIIQSGAPDAKKRQRCLDLGAYDFISKPYTSKEILEAIRNLEQQS